MSKTVGIQKSVFHSVDNEMRLALKCSLEEACRESTKLLGDLLGQNLDDLLDSIRTSMDDEMIVRLHGKVGPEEDFPEFPLQFRQFRTFYTCEDFFDRDENEEPEDEGSSGTMALSWRQKMVRRIAAFALLRASEGRSLICSPESKTQDGLMAVSCAAVDAWQAIALATLRETGNADYGETIGDLERRRKEKSKLGLAARRSKREMLLERIGQLCDVHREKKPKDNNLNIALAIYDQVVAYTEEIEYEFRCQINPEDETPFAYRIERLIGEARPRRQKK